MKVDEVLHTDRERKSVFEKYMNTEPAASDNINRMRLVINDDKKVLLPYGRREMERNAIFARQVYMNLV